MWLLDQTAALRSLIFQVQNIVHKWVSRLKNWKQDCPSSQIQTPERNKQTTSLAGTHLTTKMRRSKQLFLLCENTFVKLKSRTLYSVESAIMFFFFFYIGHVSVCIWLLREIINMLHSTAQCVDTITIHLNHSFVLVCVCLCVNVCMCQHVSRG